MEGERECGEDDRQEGMQQRVSGRRITSGWEAAVGKREGDRRFAGGGDGGWRSLREEDDMREEEEPEKMAVRRSGDGGGGGMITCYIYIIKHDF